MSKFSNLVQQVSLLSTVGPTRTGVQSRAQRQGVPLTTTVLSAADVLYAFEVGFPLVSDAMELDLDDGTVSGAVFAPDAGVDFEGEALPAMSAVRALIIQVQQGVVTLTDGDGTNNYGTLAEGSTFFLSDPTGDLAEKFGNRVLKLIAQDQESAVQITVAATIDD